MKRLDIRRQKDYRIRKKARKALKHLVFLAENLDEDQHAQVFSESTLLPLFEALLLKYQAKIEKKEGEIVSNERLFMIASRVGSLCLYSISPLINEDYRRLLLGTDMRLFPETRDLTTITTIYYMLKGKTEKEEKKKREKLKHN